MVRGYGDANSAERRLQRPPALLPRQVSLTPGGGGRRRHGMDRGGRRRAPRLVARTCSPPLHSGPLRRTLPPACLLGGLLVVAVTAGLLESSVMAPIALFLIFLVLLQWAVGPRIVEWVIPATEIPHD